MKLSVILLTWNSQRFVDNCLSSLLDAVEGFDFEIIIVDNHSTDNSLNLIRRYVDNSRIKLFPLPENIGVAAGRNYGLKQAAGDYIWFLDIDTEPNATALNAMVRMLEEHHDCGVCGCKLVNSNGEVQNSCRRFPRLKYKVINVIYSKLSGCSCFGKLFTRVNNKQFYAEKMNGQTPFEVEYIIGACQLIRRKVFSDAGLLDEAIFYGPEDADFCLRAAKAGWRVMYIPSVSFIHEYQRITNRKLLSRMTLIHTKALLYFWKKHKIL